MFFAANSPCQLVHSQLFPACELWIKRDDLLHPQVSGNKFRKLKYPLQALAGQDVHVVSMGGIWSNHLHALAHALAGSSHAGTALVRGAAGMHSAMLDDCRALGLQLRWLSRTDYRELREDPQAWRRHLPAADAHYVWLPEGGSAAAALHGVAEMIDELPFLPDAIFVACGTGATLAGLLAGLRGRSQVFGVAALPNAGYLRAEIAGLLAAAGYPDYQNYQLLTDYHHGAYARVNAELLDFCARFHADTGILLEPVYTGKMLFALRQLWLADAFPASAKIMAIHTGGLQGLRGIAALSGTAAGG